MGRRLSSRAHWLRSRRRAATPGSTTPGRRRCTCRTCRARGRRRLTSLSPAAGAAAVEGSGWSGVASASAVDNSLGGSGVSSTVVQTPVLGTSYPADLVVGAVNYPAGATSTLAGGGFTALSDFGYLTSVHGRA